MIYYRDDSVAIKQSGVIMRKELVLPENVEGEWIWSASMTDNAGSYLLMRQSFQTSAPGMDNRLWITSSCAYQLFINERFIGFGPRARQGDRSSVDVYEISGEIQSGSNAVSRSLFSCSRMVDAIILAMALLHI